jgi:hypothetical protein
MTKSIMIGVRRGNLRVDGECMRCDNTANTGSQLGAVTSCALSAL